MIVLYWWLAFCSSFVFLLFLFFYSSVTPRPLYWCLFCFSFVFLLFLFFYSSVTPRPLYWCLSCSSVFSCFSLFYLSMALRPLFRPWPSPRRFFDTVYFFCLRVESISFTPNTPTWRASCVFLTTSSFLNPSQLNFFALKALVLGVECQLYLYSLFKRVLRTAVL